MPIVYRSRVFAVEVDEVRLPNGRTVEMSIVRHPPSVVLLPIPRDGHVILVRQFRRSVGRSLWELPAGGVNTGETAEAAAARECEEEIRLVPRTIARLRSLFPAPGFCDEELVYFRLTDLNPPAADSPHRPDEDEDIHVEIFRIDDAHRMAARGDIVDLKTAYGLTLL